MRRWLLSLVRILPLLGAGTGLCSEPADDAREAGRPLLQHYSARDYGAHHQVWVGVEDANGVLHFGNRGCVLEFDGAVWGRIPVGTTTFVRGLAIAPDGRIYVGAVDELGVIETDPVGRKRFVSLRDRLPPEHREFGDIWTTAATKDGVFFAARSKVFRWHDGGFTVRDFPGAESIALHEVGGRLYLHRQGEPMRRYEAGDWVAFCDHPWLRRNRVPLLVAGPGGQLVAGSRWDGLARIDLATGVLTPWVTEADPWVRREGLQTLAPASDLMLLASRQDGIVAIDAAGRFVRKFDEADGLRDPQPKHLLATPGGNVWVALNNGVARLALPLDSTLFGREQGLDGTTVRATVRHGGRLVAATGRGIFRLEPAQADGLRNARFVALPGFSGRYFSLLDTPEGLWAGENEGLDFLAAGAALPKRMLPGVAVVMLARSERIPGRIWAGTVTGLFVLDKDDVGGWRVTPPGPALRFEARSLAEAADGALWLGTSTRGLLRVRWPEGAAEPDVRAYRESDGLPAGRNAVTVARVGGEIMATGSAGEVRRYAAGADRFEPVPELPPAERAGRAGQVWQVRSNREGQSDGFTVLTADGRTFSLEPPEIVAAAGPLQGARRESATGTVWAAGADGLARVSSAGLVPVARPPVAGLRSAEWNGRAEWPAGFMLPAGGHSVMFRFRASAFAPAAQFSTRLDGLESDWSPWSVERGREFSHLPPGNYVMRVRARNGEAVGAAEARFAFGVAAPWWWSRWWFAAGGAGLAALVGGLVRLRGRALRRRAEELETMIAARTRELEASRGELVVARDAAEAANRAKSTFLAHMSHELRTPLNAILGYAQVLARDPAQPAPAQERLGVIVASGEHLLGLINEVLDVARVEAGKMQLRAGEFPLDQLARGVADVVRGRCEEKGLAFAVRLQPGLPRRVRSDEQKLRQVLLNLLGNAVKFTAAGSVALEIGPGPDGRVRFAVTDTGRGIPPEQTAKLFLPFETTEDAGAGTGLGLALSQNLVALLGGRIEVTSEPGRGSRFWFDLPLPEAGGGAPESDAAAAGPIVGLAGPAPRVLLVDDQTTNRAVLRDLLAPLGCRIDEAADAAAALAAARTAPPDAVLLDLRFDAGPDGFEIARALRAEPALARTKIIAVSASVFESDRDRAIAAGCDEFLAKPFKADHLFAHLGSLLGIEWVRAAAPMPSAVSGTALPAAVRAELLEQARRGDARRLRARLAELAAEAKYGAEVATLDALAANFQMARLREVLSPDAETDPDHR